MKHFKVFTKKMANALCQRGFQVIGTEINNEKPWLYVYQFEDTPELRQALAEEIQRGKSND